MHNNKTKIDKMLDTQVIYDNLSALRLISKVAKEAGVHRNTVRNTLYHMRPSIHKDNIICLSTQFIGERLKAKEQQKNSLMQKAKNLMQKANQI